MFNRKEIFDKCGVRCAYCGERLNDKWHVDHKVSKRYAEYHNLDMDIDHIDNLMPSCPSCNIYKKEFTLEAFREQLGLLTGRLQKTNTIYKIAKRYGLIEETNKQIVFYFEKIAND